MLEMLDIAVIVCIAILIVINWSRLRQSTVSTLSTPKLAKQAKVLNKEELTLTGNTPITLSLAEVEEAGFARLIGDLTKYRAFVDTTNGEKFVQLPLEDLLQVIVQKMRQFNMEISDLADIKREK